MLETAMTEAEPHHEPDADGEEAEALGGPAAAGLIADIIERELGAGTARTFARVWQAQDEWEQARRPDEGLRERKKRLTRQRISDIATALFIARGFDNVRIAEIADKVGVSEKTIYNYFPTKESLVYDNADEEVSRLAAALRDRPQGSSPTGAVVDALKQETARFMLAIGDDRLDFLPAFGEMIRDTPSLRAAWSEHRHRLAEAVTEILAADAATDPRDPEPIVAGRALVSLLELFYESQLRRIEQGLTGEELRAAVDSDLERGARLLDTGLWSLNLLAQGTRTREQMLEAGRAAEQARKQVVAALREARRAWQQLRDAQREQSLAQRHAAHRERHKRSRRDQS
jgi:AcrR family transcriptional regulator